MSYSRKGSLSAIECFLRQNREELLFSLFGSPAEKREAQSREETSLGLFVYLERWERYNFYKQNKFG